MALKDIQNKSLKNEDTKTTKKKYVVLQNNTDYAGVLYQAWNTILLDNNTWLEQLFKII